MVIREVTGQGVLKDVYSKIQLPSNIFITNILNSFENRYLAAFSALDV